MRAEHKTYEYAYVIIGFGCTLVGFGLLTLEEYKTWHGYKIDDYVIRVLRYGC